MKIINYKKKIYYNSLFVNLVKFATPVILFFLKTRLVNVTGRIPQKGPLLIAAHHEELADHYLIALQTKRKLFWVADTTPFGKSLADSKLIRWILVRLGAIPIDKRNSERNVNLFSHLLYLLEKGQAIVFFPESYVRYERDGNKFGSFKDGVIRLSKKYQSLYKKPIPILPIGLCYKRQKSVKTVSLNIGNPQINPAKAKLFQSIKNLS
ncbi:MAG: lysophospholipid acyltransferase family protein [Nanoarchaeota archaeon]